MTQTIYGFILMLSLAKSEYAASWVTCLITGIIGGIAIALSAAFQGRAAAGACDALVEGGQGFVNYLIALGVIETIAIFVLVFAILLLGKITPAPEAAKAAADIVQSLQTMLA